MYCLFVLTIKMEKEMTKDWFVGFIEGEGNFHIGLMNTKNMPSYPPLMHIHFYSLGYF